MGRCEWRTAAGVRYLWLDYDGATHEEAVALLQQSVELVLAEPAPVKVLLNAGQNQFTAAFLSQGRKAYHDVFRPLGTRTYMVGLPPVPKMALDGLHRLGQARSDLAFPDVETALAAVVAQVDPA